MNIKTDLIDRQYSESPRDLGIYIHIPFCVKKCDYCDFLSAPATEEIKKQYIEALLTEIESKRDTMMDYIVTTIFFGGGTPSCIDANDIARILDVIRSIFRIDEDRLEATIEINPGTITESKLRTYRTAGINRLSFGLQSVNEMELKLLGRIHTYEQFTENYFLARELGFQNINIDLMSALPGQTLATWENTLNTVLDLHPEHISAYSLIVEEDTMFYELYREGGIRFKDLPDEETDRLMYHKTKEILKLHGYERYEISNYARAGYRCAHNCTYWNGKEYLGFGIGATSLMNGSRMKNISDLKQYIKVALEWKQTNPMQRILMVEETEELSISQRMEEYMFLGLRMTDGISRAAFRKRFEIDIDTIYGEVFKKLYQKGFIQSNQDWIQLTELGTDVSNVVLAEFLL